MKAKILGLLAVGLLVGPMAAHAIAIPAIEIVKRVNGFDANDPAYAPIVDVGSSLTFLYTVTNSGGLFLDAYVTDDKLGDICALSLAAGASATCTVFGSLAVAGLQMNIGAVTGTTAAGVVVYDEDIAYYFGGTAVPEPGSLALLGLGLAGLGLGRRRRAH